MAGCGVARGACRCSIRTRKVDDAGKGLDLTVGSQCIGRPGLDRPNCWAGAPAQITALTTMPVGIRDDTYHSNCGLCNRVQCMRS